MSTSNGIACACGIMVTAIFMRSAVLFISGFAVAVFWVGFGLGRG